MPLPFLDFHFYLFYLLLPFLAYIQHLSLLFMLNQISEKCVFSLGMYADLKESTIKAIEHLRMEGNLMVNARSLGGPFGTADHSVSIGAIVITT